MLHVFAFLNYKKLKDDWMPNLCTIIANLYVQIFQLKCF